MQLNTPQPYRKPQPYGQKQSYPGNKPNKLETRIFPTSKLPNAYFAYKENSKHHASTYFLQQTLNDKILSRLKVFYALDTTPCEFIQNPDGTGYLLFLNPKHNNALIPSTKEEQIKNGDFIAWRINAEQAKESKFIQALLGSATKKEFSDTLAQSLHSGYDKSKALQAYYRNVINDDDMPSKKRPNSPTGHYDFHKLPAMPDDKSTVFDYTKADVAELKNLRQEIKNILGEEVNIYFTILPHQSNAGTTYLQTSKQKTNIKDNKISIDEVIEALENGKTVMKYIQEKTNTINVDSEKYESVMNLMENNPEINFQELNLKQPKSQLTPQKAETPLPSPPLMARN